MAQQEQPPLLVVTSSRPPPAAAAASSAASVSTSCAAVVDPATGWGVLPALRTGAGVGLAGLHRYPAERKFASAGAAGGGGLGGLDVYYGRGAGGGVAAASGRRASANKDENIYLIAHRHASASSASGGGGGGAGDKAALAATGQRWRTKPPEPLSSGVCVSPCGTFVLAGAKSGRCYVWNALGSSGGGGADGGGAGGASSGGELIRVWAAHNRPVTCLSFSSDGSLVLTAGQDGIVNAYSLLDVVSSPSSDRTTGGAGAGAIGAIDNSIRPVRTFSEHHLPVSALIALPSHRAVSVSPDRQAVVMELGSGAALARIVLPASLRCAAADEAGRRLYAGGEDGVVYCVDLDAVAVRETAESATVVSIGGGGGRGGPGPGAGAGASKSSAGLVLSGSKLGETVLGVKGGRSSAIAAEASGSADGRNGGISELRGHSQAITALAVVDGIGGRGVLVSGSEEGTLRVWDLHTRACARVVQPWGGGAGAASSSTSSACPVSSILVVPRGNSYRYAASASGPFGLTSARGRGAGSSGADVLDLFRPLQRFPSDKPIGDVVPILTSSKNTTLLRRWEGDGAITEQTSQKRPRTSTNTSEMSSVEPASKDDENDEDDGFLSMSSGAPSSKNTSSEDDEKAALRKELEEARATISRWEKVNNKLAKKLEKTKETTEK